MLKTKLKIWQIVVLGFALGGFLLFSNLGEFLHNQIHHHQNRTAQQECFFSQVQSQQILVAIVFTAFLFSRIDFFLFRRFRPVIFLAWRILLLLRAPPISLL